MALQIEQRDTEYKTDVPARQVLGVVWHSTETRRAVAPHAGGSWHYEIGRRGQVLQYVRDGVCAWGAADHDRWRPAWLPDRIAGWNISNLNVFCLHVELVSHAHQRAAGQAYTDAQYRSARALTAELEQRHGALQHIGHGMVQADRSDPVAWDWARAGFVVQADGGYLFQPGEVVDAAEAAQRHSAYVDWKLTKVGGQIMLAIQALRAAEVDAGEVEQFYQDYIAAEGAEEAFRAAYQDETGIEV